MNNHLLGGYNVLLGNSHKDARKARKPGCTAGAGHTFNEPPMSGSDAICAAGAHCLESAISERATAGDRAARAAKLSPTSPRNQNALVLVDPTSKALPAYCPPRFISSITSLKHVV
ncbi:hypothetical protein B0H65DRAFT_444586 [Neurospora tetraspora]|uniref:Uncharacterized protein n=1 Tax=Neurospora tetraspora TaxID=94610 RepID=A0AAE0MPG4_9PEZI|nr:hypothetical protein B0H65DRAFT_444586 [Neurospora tetraspora]